MSTCVLTMVEQIITAICRDLESCMHRPIDEQKLGSNFELKYFGYFLSAVLPRVIRIASLGFF